MAVMAAANRDPARFPDPDRLDLTARTTDSRLRLGSAFLLWRALGADRKPSRVCDLAAPPAESCARAGTAGLAAEFRAARLDRTAGNLRRGPNIERTPRFQNRAAACWRSC